MNEPLLRLLSWAAAMLPILFFPLTIHYPVTRITLYDRRQRVVFLSMLRCTLPLNVPKVLLFGGKSCQATSR